MSSSAFTATRCSTESRRGSRRSNVCSTNEVDGAIVNLDRVEKIAEAVLYEGYMLYPYRPSSVKNQQRWNFGVLYPPSWCDSAVRLRSIQHETECLLKTTSSTRLTVKVRFLQIVQRSVAKLQSPAKWMTPEGGAPSMEIVDRLEVGWPRLSSMAGGGRTTNLPATHSIPRAPLRFSVAILVPARHDLRIFAR